MHKSQELKYLLSRSNVSLNVCLTRNITNNTRNTGARTQKSQKKKKIAIKSRREKFNSKRVLFTHAVLLYKLHFWKSMKAVGVFSMTENRF